MKTMRNNFNLTSTRYGNVVKIGSFVHTDKCGVLSITHAKDHTSYTYELSSCTLQRNGWFGVSWHLNYPGIPKRKKVVNKANTEIAGFRKWNVRPGNKEVFSHLYKALVIPILEYAVPLFSPYNNSKKNINIAVLKRFKRRASSMLSWRLSAVWRKTGSAWLIQSPINEVFFIFVRVLYDYSWS